MICCNDTLNNKTSVPLEFLRLNSYKIFWRRYAFYASQVVFEGREDFLQVREKSEGLHNNVLLCYNSRSDVWFQSSLMIQKEQWLSRDISVYVNLYLNGKQPSSQNISLISSNVLLNLLLLFIFFGWWSYRLNHGKHNVASTSLGEK